MKLFVPFLLLGATIQRIAAGPVMYGICQSIVALGCGPVGYGACQAASWTACLATGPGVVACYATLQAACASLGGASFAACYAGGQAGCAAAVLAPTP